MLTNLGMIYCSNLNAMQPYHYIHIALMVDEHRHLNSCDVELDYFDVQILTNIKDQLTHIDSPIA